MRRRHLHIVIACLSVLLAIAAILLAVLYRNGSSNSTYDFEIENEIDTSRCNIGAQMARDLSESDILFVADQAQFASQSRLTIVEFLDYWSTAQPGVFEGRLRNLESLTLAMSLDSSALLRANRYMETWDYEDIAVAAQMQDSNFTTADLEFYWRIGNIRHRLSAASVRDERWKRVSLVIVAIPSSRAAMGDEAKSVRIAEELVSYRESHPSRKIIALLGEAQLYRMLPSYYGKALMSTSAVLELEKYWGARTRMITVAQADRNRWPFVFQRGVPDCDFVLPYSSLENTAIKCELPAVLRFDRLVLRSRPPELPLPISSVPSMHVARVVVASMPILMDSTGFALWPAMLTYLDAVSGAPPLRVNVRDRTATREACIQWQGWADTAQINIVEEIVSLRMWTNLIDKIAGGSKLVARHYDETLMSILPGAPAFDARFDTPTKAERAAQLRGYLTRNRDKIVVRMLINVLWVGDQGEKSDALSALARETGIRFNTAAEWSKWYRDGRPDDW